MKIKKNSKAESMKIIDYKKIDPKIRKLIKAMNDVGIITRASCEGHDSCKKAYVSIDMQETKGFHMYLNGTSNFGIYWDRE